MSNVNFVRDFIDDDDLTVCAAIIVTYIQNVKPSMLCSLATTLLTWKL